MKKSKNDIEWERIFEKYNIIEKVQADGHAIITATQINEYREARLMTKFDHKSQLPKLFSDNNFSILPTSRGGYVVGTFHTFCDFNTDDVEVAKIEFPSFLKSLNYKDITSEATAINCAFVSKILHDFTSEENLWPTVSGRMSSSSFKFEIDSETGRFEVDVGNSQVEIDGGYEGDASLNLIEAKNYISADFLIRQLYYPFKLWKNKIGKKVRPIFLTYTNGIFHLREYDFENINHYNSLRLIKQGKYAVQEGAISIEMIKKALGTVKAVKEPEVPFPQADSFDRVVNIGELLKQKGFMSKEEITLNYDFDARQTDYYTNAGKYLGLIEVGNENQENGCRLTEKGNKIFDIPLVERQKEFIKLILSHKPFKKALKLYFDNGNVLNTDEIVEIMKASKLYGVKSDSTFFRRASTIWGWINWITRAAGS